jgi:hypothetical protein
LCVFFLIALPCTDIPLTDDTDEAVNNAVEKGRQSVKYNSQHIEKSALEYSLNLALDICSVRATQSNSHIYVCT